MSGFRRFANDPPVDVLYAPAPKHTPLESKLAKNTADAVQDQKPAKKKSRREILRETDAEEKREEKLSGLTPLDRAGLRFLGLLDRLSFPFATMAIWVAVIISCYALISVYSGPLTSIQEGLLTGSIFFWIELFAIVLGFRLLDRLSARAAYRRPFYQLDKKFKETIQRIDDERYNFAVNLDGEKNKTGAYSTDLWYLYEKIGVARGDILALAWCNPNLSAALKFAFERVIRLFDMVMEQTFNEMNLAIEENKAENPSREKIDAYLSTVLMVLTNPREQGFVRLSNDISEARKQAHAWGIALRKLGDDPKPPARPQ